MHTTQYPDLFVTYSERFRLITGIKNPIIVDEDSSLCQQPTSSPLVLNR